MSDESARKSQAAMWGLSVAAAFLLYVLSIGPVIYLQQKNVIPIPIPPWLQFVYKPVFWMAKVSPLNEMLSAYANWWAKLAIGGDPFYVRPASSELPGPDPFASPPSAPATPDPFAAPKLSGQ